MGQSNSSMTPHACTCLRMGLDGSVNLVEHHQHWQLQWVHWYCLWQHQTWQAHRGYMLCHNEHTLPIDSPVHHVHFAGALQTCLQTSRPAGVLQTSSTPTGGWGHGACSNEHTGSVCSRQGSCVHEHAQHLHFDITREILQEMLRCCLCLLTCAWYLLLNLFQCDVELMSSCTVC